MRCFTSVTDQHIYIDEVAEEFLTRLGELVKRSGYSELDIANKLHVHETLPRAWRIRRSAPSVGTFLRLAEILNYDISGSVNYQWYHGTLKAKTLYQQLKRRRLDYKALADEIGYNARYVKEVLENGNLENAPVQFIGHLLKYLNKCKTR